MVVYSIKDLEQLSGVKAHTLRIWEKRYNILKPKRTATNIRYYLDEDLKLILNIALLNRHGLKISKIAGMSREQIQSKVAEISDVDQSFESQLDTLTISLLELDDEKFSKILNKKIEERGFTNTMIDVIYPMLDKMAMMWLTGSIKTIHEKFITNLIQRKCIAEIDKLTYSRKEKFLIFIPQGKANELSLLFLHYLIRERGFHVVSTGTNVRFDELLEVKRFCEPQFVCSIINEPTQVAEFEKHLNDLYTEFDKSTIIVSGIQSLNTNLSKYSDRLVLLHSLQDVIDYLLKL